MSAIADFRIIETAKLDELLKAAEVKIEKKLFSKKVINKYGEYLDSTSRELIGFPWSGYIFADLMIFLQEKKGIDLLNSEYRTIADSVTERQRNATFILTYLHKEKYFNDLSPDKFTQEELMAFNKEFSEQDDPQLVKAEIAGIEALQKSLGLLTDQTRVIILSVG